MNDIRECDVESVNAVYLDCCLSDYFQGSGAHEVLAVPMWADITYKEAYEAAKDEFHNASGWFDGVAGSGSMVEDALHSMFSGIEDVNAKADFAKYIEDDDGSDCCESVYLYIGLFAE
jgi:hypothetical protein